MHESMPCLSELLGSHKRREDSSHVNANIFQCLPKRLLSLLRQHSYPVYEGIWLLWVKRPLEVLKCLITLIQLYCRKYKQ